MTPVFENDVLSIYSGAMAGVFIGWFDAVAVRKKQTISSGTNWKSIHGLMSNEIDIV